MTVEAPPRAGRLLVVDDEPELTAALCDALRGAGYDAVGVTRPEDGLAELRNGVFDLLLSDLMMPGTDGIQLLRRALAVDPTLVGVIMTGQASVPTAVEAMRAGAYDYVLKPFRLQQVLPVLDRAMELRRLRLENVRLRSIVARLTFESPRYHLVGRSPAMHQVVRSIERVAGTDATVLVRGESGTGKELVARAVHGNSPRRDKPLVTVNCAAMQEALLESELFGHEKGSFTGATAAKPGLFEAAEGGTLFIDEVAEMAPAMQAKLLRVLEDRRYRRVGGTRELAADVRLVAATNKPLEDEQRAGRFREDLFYRLNVFAVTLPPLRDRREDIPLLVDHLLHTRQLGRTPARVDPAALAALSQYDWPGNVRELANVLERAQILAEGGVITPDDLPDGLTAITCPPTDVSECPDTLAAVERRHVADVLRRAGGNKVQAARVLGVSRRSLYRLLHHHGLEGPQAEQPEPGTTCDAT